MSKAIVAQQATQPRVKIVEIDIVRSGHFYFMNRRENGRTVVNANQIKRDRAQEIYSTNNGHGRQRSINTVDFTDIRPREWSWTVTLEVRDGDAA